MKIDAETLKKQVILHLPYVLFLLVFAKLGEAVRLAPAKMWNMVLQDGEIKPILPRLWTQIRKTISFLPKVKD